MSSPAFQQYYATGMGAVADGSHDDGPAINNALANVLEKGATLIFPAGNYFVRTGINLLDQKNLHFLAGSTVTGGTTSALVMSAPGNIVVSGFGTFVGGGGATGVTITSGATSGTLTLQYLSTTITNSGGASIVAAPPTDASSNTADARKWNLLNTFSALYNGNGLRVIGIGDSVVDLGPFPGLIQALSQRFGYNGGLFQGGGIINMTPSGTFYQDGPIDNAISITISGKAATSQGTYRMFSVWLLKVNVSSVAGLFVDSLVNLGGTVGGINDGPYFVVSIGTNSLVLTRAYQLNPPGAPFAQKTISDQASESGTITVTIWHQRIQAVPSGSNLKWTSPNSTYIPSDTFKVYYIKESGAGTFTVEKSTDGSTWTTLVSSVSCSNAATIGAVSTSTATQGLYQFRVRVTSGTCRILGGGCYCATGYRAKGVIPIDLSQGGIQLCSFSSLPSAILNPVLTDLNPTIGILHIKDGFETIQIDIPNLESRLASACPAYSISTGGEGTDGLPVGTGSSLDLAYILTPNNLNNGVTSDGISQQNTAMKAIASSYGRPVFDAFPRYFGGNTVLSQAWGILRKNINDPDGVHSTTIGGQFMAWQILALLQVDQMPIVSGGPNASLSSIYVSTSGVGSGNLDVYGNIQAHAGSISIGENGATSATSQWSLVQSGQNLLVGFYGQYNIYQFGIDVESGGQFFGPGAGTGGGSAVYLGKNVYGTPYNWAGLCLNAQALQSASSKFAGTIAYDGTHFYGCNGTAWKQLDN